MRRGRRVLCARVATPLLFLLLAGSAALGQVFSLDPASPFLTMTGGSPADLYTPGPVLYAQASDIGLLPGDNIQAFSWGWDRIDPGVAPIFFSTDWFASGAVAPGNAVCIEAGTNPVACGGAAPCAPPTAGEPVR